MSWFESTTLTCPHCAEEFPGHSAETINVTRMPSARQQILAGTFHRVTCPACGRSCHIDRSFLYSDMTQRHFVHVFPRSSAAEWTRWEDVAEQTFIGAFENAPPAMREMGRGFKVRAVFGLGALRDKLLIWDAKLDDALIELLKLELLTSEPSLMGRTDLWIDVVAIAPDEQRIDLEVSSLRGDAEVMRYGVRMARYRELALHREQLEQKFPGLFLRPFVGFRRLARELHAVQMVAPPPPPPPPSGDVELASGPAPS